MNRLTLITILVFVLPVILSAQINWTEHTIDTNFNCANSVYAIDLDSDGDVDVLGAAWDWPDLFGVIPDITWWENDGNENFTEHTIADDFEGAHSVYAIDLDNDEDVDVLGAAFMTHRVTWWENDGNENFTEHNIAHYFAGAYSVYAIDLDNDEDVDVLGAARDADDITWWENDGANPPGFTENTIDSTFDGANSVYGIDLDSDGDVDVLGAAKYDDAITWWENDGNENFTEHTIADNFDYAHSVYAIDLDNDEDVDVLGAAYDADEITWWENDGNENFTEHTIADDFDHAYSVYGIDLDSDGDVDVLGAPYVIPMSGASNITWWENGLMGIHDVETVSPGGFLFRVLTISRGEIKIEFTLPEATRVDLLIYDAIGRLRKTLVSDRLSTGTHSLIANFNLPGGIYFVRFNTGDYEEVQKIVLIR